MDGQQVCCCYKGSLCELKQSQERVQEWHRKIMSAMSKPLDCSERREELIPERLRNELVYFKMGIGLKVYDVNANVIGETHLTYTFIDNT